MTDGPSSSGRPGSFGAASGSGNVPRRISYASAASGANVQHVSNTFRAGTYAHMATTTPSGPYAQAQSGEIRTRRSSQEQDPAGGPKRQSQLPSYSRKYAGLPTPSAKQNNNFFFIPSYMQSLKYAAKLKDLNAKRWRNERDSRSGLNSGVSSVNQSLSSVNTHRIAPSHRGMTYEVIESNPPKDEQQILPLPSRWSEQDKYPGLDISPDGLEVKYNGSAPKSDVEAASVRADYPMPLAAGFYYFEVEIKSKGKDCAVAIGFSTSKASLERLPGWESDSWAYHGDDGKTFGGEHNGRPYSQTFSAGDIIGCGINFGTGQGFFAKNGTDLGVAFRELKNVKLFPCIGIKKYSGAVVRVNFGQEPFVFDIDGKVATERTIIENNIRRTKANTLHPNLDETSLVQALVSQFLTHGGYVETSKAFEEDLKKERRSLGNLSESSSESSNATDVDSTHASNRQRIRRAVLAGEVDGAFDLMNVYYPGVLQTSPEIAFHLKCRKWIELIRKAADLRSHRISTSESHSFDKAANGPSKASMSAQTVEDVFDQRMELDEFQQAAANITGRVSASATSFPTDTDMAYNQLMSQAMEYGQILQREYRDEKDGEYSKKLQDIFSLIIYDEPSNSEHGHLLDLDGRVKVAEEVNSAILVLLGRPPTAALENTYKQTEALLEMLGAEGGPAALVNLQATFKQH